MPITALACIVAGILAGAVDVAVPVIAPGRQDGARCQGQRRDRTAPARGDDLPLTARAVIAQRDIDAKKNEITQVKPLLDDVDISEVLVTADALHVQKETARYLVEDQKAGYLSPRSRRTSRRCSMPWTVRTLPSAT